MCTRLLIVDDQSNARELIRSFLTIPGMMFQECASGTDAIACVREFRPHWVTMDVKMPGLNGFETIKGIKQAHPEARIIIVTSFNEPQFRDLARSAGAVGFILKENLLALRLLLEREAKDAERNASVPATPESSEKASSKRVLVLDDENETLAMLKPLADKGYQIIRAKSGAEAVVLHRQNPFQVVTIELLMADYNGFEAFAQLRREPSPPKFIATAKHGWAAADICLKMAKQLGAHETLAKPFLAEHLLVAVESILK
jgi:CheY-like chemotaxis protein